MTHSQSIASLPARQFNSKLALQVYLDPEAGMFSDMGPLLGTTPSDKPLSIPKGRMWCVVPGAGATNDQLVAEIRAQQIPGLALPSVAAGDDLSFLEKLPNLRSLRLTGDGVTDAQLAHLKPMTKLEELYLPSDQNITDAGIGQMQGQDIDDLLKLDLSGTRITGAGLKDFDLIALEMLNLKNSSITDDGLIFVEGCSNLVGLYLAHTNVTDAGMHTVQTHGTMREFDLRDTQIDDVGLENFENLSDLTLLDLANTKVSSVGMEYLQEMTSLQSLNLSNTQVDDRGLQYIKLMTQLQKLDLSKTNVTAAGAAAIKQAIAGCLVEYP
jgi:Leucine-rich repeat (LRR) protein